MESPLSGLVLYAYARCMYEEALPVMSFESIEPHLRRGGPLDDEALLVRGGPLQVANIVQHSLRQERRFAYQGLPMASISVFAAVGKWTLERVLVELLWSRSWYGICSAGQLKAGGFVCLPTESNPHYDVLLQNSTEVEAHRLLSVFGDGFPNPHKRRRGARVGSNGEGDGQGAGGHPL